MSYNWQELNTGDVNKLQNGEFMIILTPQQCFLDNGIIKFPEIMNL